MPKYSDIIKFQDEAPNNVIRLVKSGEFYRAYDHSAWLFQCCIAEHKVIRKYVKSISREIYYIGFPEKSLFGNIGEHKSEKTDYGFDIVLANDELPDEKDYETWKNNVVTEQASKGDYHSLPLAGAEAEREVVRRLRDFTIENKTMVECVVFLAELRGMLVQQ